MGWEILLNVRERAVESKVLALRVRAWLYIAVQESEERPFLRRPALTLQKGRVWRDELLVPGGELSIP